MLNELEGESLSLLEKDDYPPESRIEGTDAVVHVGAIAGVHSELSPIDYFEYNVKRTVDLLEASKKAKMKKFIFISTCTISHGVRNLYDVSKLQAEQWCDIYRKYIGDVTVLRLYNVYGEGDNKSVVAKFVKAVKSGTTITIDGSGKQTRDFVHVDDVVRAIKKVLYSGQNSNQVFEVGTGKEESIIGLAETIFRIAGKRVPVKFGLLPYPQLESAKCPEPLFIDNPIRLEDGLKRLVAAWQGTIDASIEKEKGR